ncbi:PadR family transcriptional regulator [Peptostreptococcus faecalis]|uniref:PadR family transcriptional regulator n=1 Tax=Peptostreptococcus faecalis TaxID=2045015 RepID=UPI000C79A6BA|nr:PadR family transcriptional regulator [Peptostreptococcus faecalis]
MQSKSSSQMLKGILSGSILVLLSKEAMYGYNIGVKLSELGFEEIPRGTIYPLLLSLEKKGFIEGEFRPSADGPDRKYYSLTSEGKEERDIFKKNWNELKIAVDTLLKEGCD